MTGWLTVFDSYREELIEVALCALRLYEANNYVLCYRFIARIVFEKDSSEKSKVRMLGFQKVISSLTYR